MTYETMTIYDVIDDEHESKDEILMKVSVWGSLENYEFMMTWYVFCENWEFTSRFKPFYYFLPLLVNI